jgi:hypothetical protein
MKNSKTKKLALTELEYDLIETGRNYRRSFPLGDPNLRYYLERLFVEWLEGDNED